MLKNTLMNRSAPLAIAASLSLLSTPAIAQEAVADPTPVEVPSAAETVTVAPSDSTPVVEAAPASEPTVATTSAPATVESKASRTARPMRANTAAASAAPAASRASPASAPLVAEPEAPIAGIDAPTAEPTADTVAPTAVVTDDGLDALTFGGILGLLVLGGGFTALARRRRKVTTAQSEPAPVAPRQAPMPAVAPTERSAFAWGQREPVRDEPATTAGGNWIERARRGPTPDNPSLSLKKRLKRAAFFERREREVAAGSAKPVAARAGLPQRTAAALGSAVPALTHDRALQPA